MRSSSPLRCWEDTKVKAITLTQPWASLVAIGAKRIETRSWSTSYRGSLAIHAGAGLGPVGGVRGLRARACREPFISALRAGGYDLDQVDVDALPRGAIVAVARLHSIYRITAGGVEGFRPQPPANEIAFGDYTPGRYAWLFAEVRALPEPIPAKGALGLWEWTPPEGVTL